MSVIKSVSDDQSYIIKSIMELNHIERFDADISYGKGGFWKELPRPVDCYDIDPQHDYVINASSVSLPVVNSYYKSIIFDPPFLTYIKQGREHNSIMGRQFSGYWTYSELEEHYKMTLAEAHRALSKKGIMVFKCQDIVHNHSLHPTHINVVNWAEGMFRFKDMFVLTAKHRIPVPQQEGTKKKVQKHARIYHSYFLVLENK